MTEESNLERRVRAALQDNVQGITSRSVANPNADWLTHHRSAAESRHRLRSAGLTAVAVVLLIAGIVGGVALVTGDQSPRRDAPTAADGGSLQTLGSWILIKAATQSGTSIGLADSPKIRLEIGKHNVQINNGFNVVTLAGAFDEGTLRASFKGTTYALDPRMATPGGKALLNLLDSIAPSESPNMSTKSQYTLTDVLTVKASAGELTFQRERARKTGAPGGPTVVSSTPPGTARPTR